LNTRSFFSDFMEAEFVSAVIPALLSRLGENGVTLLSVQLLDPLTVHVRFPRNAYRKIRGLAEKRGVSMRIVGKKGLFWQIKGVLNRPVLMSGILLLLFLTLWLPTRVLFVQVEGNRSISPARILDTAELCGIRFGAFSRKRIQAEGFACSSGTPCILRYTRLAGHEHTPGSYGFSGYRPRADFDDRHSGQR